MYETQNLLSLWLVSFLVGLRTYQDPWYGCSCSVFSGAEALLVRSQYASRRSCEQPTRFRFPMGSFCPKQNSKLVPTFHVGLHSFQAPSSSPLLNALPYFEQPFQKDKQALHGNVQFCNTLFLWIICIMCHLPPPHFVILFEFRSFH
jgi:hypothetical protein